MTTARVILTSAPTPEIACHAPARRSSRGALRGRQRCHHMRGVYDPADVSRRAEAMVTRMVDASRTRARRSPPRRTWSPLRSAPQVAPATCLRDHRAVEVSPLAAPGARRRGRCALLDRGARPLRHRAAACEIDARARETMVTPAALRRAAQRAGVPATPPAGARTCGDGRAWSDPRLRATSSGTRRAIPAGHDIPNRPLVRPCRGSRRRDRASSTGARHHHALRVRPRMDALVNGRVREPSPPPSSRRTSGDLGARPRGRVPGARGSSGSRGQGCCTRSVTSHMTRCHSVECHHSGVLAESKAKHHDTGVIPPHGGPRTKPPEYGRCRV